MGPTWFLCPERRQWKTRNFCFSRIVHVNCTVHWTLQLAWTVYIDTLFMWTVQENCTVHFKKKTVQFTHTIHEWIALFMWTFLFFFLQCVNFFNIFFKKKTSLKWIKFTRALWREHYFFSWKTSIEWIKFTRTVISILYLIIFYLILLHAQKIMKTVVLIRWILYVMEL